MKTLLKIFFIFISISTFSQEMPTIKVGEERLGITTLNVKVEVVGNVVTTTYDMLFFNPTNSILEGELAFPLGEGQRVSRLALEVNGKLREAVVVEKEQGRVAFEAVVRRGVDPVLLEKGTGNNYKARIYPIPAKGHKRIVLAHEQELIFSEGAHYFHLPLGFKKDLDVFALEMKVFNQKIKPSLTKGRLENFQFTEKTNNYYAKIEKKNFKPEEDLIIKIPQPLGDNKIITNDDYFYIYKTLKPNLKLRDKPKSITIFWDASLSMKSRGIDKELQFLGNYITHLQNVKIDLVKFSNQIISTKSYVINNGECEEVKEELVNTVYDGGTSFASLFLSNTSDEVLLFSDGMKNLSDLVINITQPIFVINSIVKANHSELNSLCESTNGVYVNLKNTSIKESIEKIKYQSFKFLGFEASNPNMEVYPNTSFSVSSDFSISGKNFNSKDSIILKFGYGNKVIEKQTIHINSFVNNELVKRIWAEKKLNTLQKDSELNKETIVAHSKAYNLVSNHTSLIVLETVWDYVRYKITPPEELLEAYNKILERNNGKKVASVQGQEDNEDDEIVTRSLQNEGNISGIITDGSGQPLPGVNVVVKGTRTGTNTDFDGNYSINASPGDILTFSYIGMVSLETTIGESSVVSISMEEDSSSLDEVVVVGFGTQKKSSVVGSVTEIREERLNNSTDIAGALQGRVSGLQVVRNNSLGNSSNITLRGNASIRGGGQPLFVLDGVPITGNIEDFVNIHDVESITVLKSISATAIYGSRATNGVIIITTKISNTPFSDTTNTANSNTENNNTIEDYTIYKGRLKVKKNKVNESYIKELSKSKSLEEAYEIYLSQRDEYEHILTYFIDVYDYFKKWNNKDIELRILTNIAELDFDNYELLRVLGYKLEEENNYGLASYIYAQVLKLRPEDSQSYRDLALTYQEIGLVQESYKLLNSIVSEDIYKNKNRRKFSGMQQIARNEINKLIQNNKALEEGELDKKKIDDTAFDVRIVIDWNHNDTDIDLHVIDPKLEECFYSHSKTKIGGQLSQDMTQGFGPEEFTLKNAIKGEYFIKVNYYGDRYQKIENPTFMKVTMFKNFGKSNETKEVKIIRLTKAKDKQIVAKLEI